MRKLKMWYAQKLLDLAILWDKAKKEALKLSFAVVVAEIVLVSIFALSVKYGVYELLQPKTITITNTAEAKTTTQKPEVVKDEMEELKDFIWNKESTRGKNNYSKCEAQGKVNGIGYGIDDSGNWVCFESHEEEMKVLEGWIIYHKAQGMNRLEMLKHYTPSYTGK
jgi:hypothetical protein